MKNRVLGAMVVAASLAGAMTPGQVVTSAKQHVVVAPGESSAPGLSRMQMLQQIAQRNVGTGGGWGWRGPTYLRRGGWSVAEGKRRARKARNRLRAKGQHRRAVR